MRKTKKPPTALDSLFCFSKIPSLNLVITNTLGKPLAKRVYHILITIAAALSGVEWWEGLVSMSPLKNTEGLCHLVGHTNGHWPLSLSCTVSKSQQCLRRPSRDKLSLWVRFYPIITTIQPIITSLRILQSGMVSYRSSHTHKCSHCSFIHALITDFYRKSSKEKKNYRLFVVFQENITESLLRIVYISLSDS